MAPHDEPVLDLFDGWNTFFPERVDPRRIALAERARARLEAVVLPAFLRRQRWYAARSEALPRVMLRDHVLLVEDGHAWMLGFVDASTGAGVARYFLPLAIAFDAEDDERARSLRVLAAAAVRAQAATGVLADAIGDERFCRALLRLVGERGRVATAQGALCGVPGAKFGEQVGGTLGAPMALRCLTSSSNSVNLLGERLFLKFYRRLQPAESLELEMGRHLTDVVGFEHCVPVLGHVEYRAADGWRCTVALLQSQVENQGDVGSFVVGRLASVLASVRAAESGEPARPGVEGVEGVEGALDAIAARLALLARRVAELHLALARRTGDPAFEPEPIRPDDVRQWSRSVREDLRRTFEQLRCRLDGLGEPLRTLAQQVLAAQQALQARIDAAAQIDAQGCKTRIHGDLHLEQVLISRDDFVLIDFEGEPRRPIEERRAKHSAWRDVAGMLRSFDYARDAALHVAAPDPTERQRLEPLARRCEQHVRAAFLAAYRATALAGGLYPPEGEAAAAQLLDLFELEKALYELGYELDQRPDKLGIPLGGVAALARPT